MRILLQEKRKWKKSFSYRFTNPFNFPESAFPFPASLCVGEYDPLLSNIWTLSNDLSLGVPGGDVDPASSLNLETLMLLVRFSNHFFRRDSRFCFMPSISLKELVLITYSKKLLVSDTSLSYIKGYRSVNKQFGIDSFLNWADHDWGFTHALASCSHSLQNTAPYKLLDNWWSDKKYENRGPGVLWLIRLSIFNTTLQQNCRKNYCNQSS